MASSGLLRGDCKVIVVLLTCLHIFTVSNCVEIKVGGDNGWVVPSSSKDDDQIYNLWASNNRFKPNDTLRFEYNKDSVLVVTKEEYEKCESSNPMFFSNSGNTTFTLDRPGLFYFISGVSGHCEGGLKMIIKVLEPQTPSPPPQPANQTEPPKKSGALLIEPTIIMFTLSFLGSLFM